MRIKNEKFTKYLYSVILIVITLIVVISQNSQGLTKEDYKLLNDYTSKIYQEVSPSELGMSYAELLSFLKIPESKKEKFSFKFYKLNYKDISELHAKGIGNKCYNVALTNADDFFNSYSEASILSFFQESEPVEVTHSCEGDPCPSCYFKRDNETHEITGCGCNYWLFGLCNHTITTDE